jgi:hypothetical protein
MFSRVLMGEEESTKWIVGEEHWDKRRVFAKAP